MDPKRIVMLVVGASVMVLIFSAILVPIIGDATATQKTFKNMGIVQAVTLDENSEHTMSFDYTQPNVVVVDSEPINMASLNSPYSSMSIVFSNDWFIRFVIDTGVILYKCGTSSASAIKGATASSGISMNLVISGGNATFTYSDETTYTYTVSGDGLIITAGEGDYTVKTATETAYVNEDSVVYGVGRTDRALGTGGTSFNAMVKASIADGVEPIAYSPQYTWNDNREVTYTDNPTGTDLYNLTGFTFNLVDSDSVEHPVTYNQIFVPSEVTTDLTVTPDAATRALLSAIPIVAMIGIVLAVVGVAIVGRNDY